MLLTHEQKQEVIDLYFDDFYSMNIVDWFSNYYPKETKKALKKMLKFHEISWKEWRNICKQCEKFDTEASEMWEDIELDTMNELLEQASIDPYEDEYTEIYIGA